MREGKNKHIYTHTVYVICMKQMSTLYREGREQESEIIPN